MPAQNAVQLGQELLNVPFPDMVRNLGVAIAEAQYELDLVGVRMAQLMAGYAEYIDESGVKHVTTHKVDFGGQQLSLLELGFTPTFYQFVDTVIEVKLSISINSESTSTIEHKTKTFGTDQGLIKTLFKGGQIRTSSVNANYASKYQYHAEGSSLLRTKLVTVPPPQLLEERIRKMIEDQTANP
ncbi:MAG: hypothetical protein H6739_14340 [Alphaproteobacteria bacterium]|nr:hypothetical protein [Alphaproteobacteria bacterium]